MDSLKSPCVTSYRSSIDTVAVKCLVFEKIAFLHFGDRRTDKLTDKQMDSCDALSRCRERWLNKHISSVCNQLSLLVHQGTSSYCVLCCWKIKCNKELTLSIQLIHVYHLGWWFKWTSHICNETKQDAILHMWQELTCSRLSPPHETRAYEFTLWRRNLLL